jgi:RNA polymerase-binding transcription factor DksA
MTPEQARTVLSERLEALEVRLGKLKNDISQSHSADFEEQAQERENDEVIDALGVETEATIVELRGALQRIEDGHYGLCCECGEAIHPERLEALPEARLCIDCAD